MLRYEVAPGNEDGVMYMECMKNHAAHLRVYAVDGCGDYKDEPNIIKEAQKCG